MLKRMMQKGPSSCIILLFVLLLILLNLTTISTAWTISSSSVSARISSARNQHQWPAGLGSSNRPSFSFFGPRPFTAPQTFSGVRGQLNQNPIRRMPLLPLSVSLSEPETTSSSSSFPELGDDGVYHILNREQHAAFLEANRDKLIIMKVFAPWCRACKGLEPKFLSLVQNDVYKNLPIAFCDLSIQHNKAFVKELGVLALPSVQFYVGNSLTDNFPCGPSKFPILKRKLSQLVNNHVDPKTRLLKESSLADVQEQVTANETMVPPPPVKKKLTLKDLSKKYIPVEPKTKDVAPPTRTRAPPAPAPVASSQLHNKTETEILALLVRIPYMDDLSIADLDQVLSKAKVLQFEAGSILMREGKPGRTLYVLLDGEVEICQQTAIYYSDPLLMPQSPSNYLGAVINRLSPGDYFGERALITGEPRAASIRAAEKVTCLSLDRDDFPASCVLSGKTRNTYVTGQKFVDDVNDKYGISLGELEYGGIEQQIMGASTASQVRGSVNTPQVIRGVDTEEEVEVEEILEELTERTPAGVTDAAASDIAPAAMKEADVVSLLTRFQMIRQVSQCLNYILQTRAQWGDAGTRKRRNMLVMKLTPAQKQQFTDTFHLIDKSGDGTISLLELKTVMESIGETRTDDELIQALSQGDSDTNRLTLEDFIGIMAESEFYHLFRDIFASLDPRDTGFVRAKSLNRILCGVRDLISDDRKSIIDVEDQEMQIDYEQFSRMMLGTALI